MLSFKRRLALKLRKNVYTISFSFDASVKFAQVKKDYEIKFVMIIMQHFDENNVTGNHNRKKL